MNDKPELLAAGKTLPPWLALLIDKVSGFGLNEWVLVAALIYTSLQIFVLVRDRIINRQPACALPDEYVGEDRRRRTRQVSVDRRQGGAANLRLVFGVSAASLAVAIGAVASLYEGDGPTTVNAAGETIHHAYPDPALGWDKPTICQGRTRGVFPGMTATADQCRLWLSAEIEQGVVAALARNIKVPLTFDQAVQQGSFLDNIGETQYRASAVLRRLNAGDCKGAAHEMNASPQIDRASGQPRRWAGRPIVWLQREPLLDPVSGRVIWKKGDVMLATGAPIMKWTTAGGIPLAGLIKRRTLERLVFERDC